MGLFDSDTESAKVLLVGDQGHGKTGAKAALIAAGYKLHMIDVDRGSKILRSLLTDPHYPYAEYMKRHGVDPREPGRISCIPINVPMDVVNTTIRREGRNISYDILAPTSSRPWSQALDLMRNWKDGDLNLGGITDWDNDVIFDIDTLSTLAELAKYWNQALNGRPGALEDDHGRDTYAAQELISRLAIKLTNPEVRCNVILTTHRTWIDMDRGAPLSPEQLLREKKSVQAKGYPTIIGRALSPFLGKRWNDQLIVKQSDRGEQRIYTEMTDNTSAKHSVWLEPSYPLSSGLAEIFAALQFKELPEDFIPTIRGKETSGSTSADSAKPGFGGSGGFGSR